MKQQKVKAGGAELILYHGSERKDKTDVNATIEYYNENAVSFYSETADIDFSEIQNVF